MTSAISFHTLTPDRTWSHMAPPTTEHVRHDQTSNVTQQPVHQLSHYRRRTHSCPNSLSLSFTHTHIKVTICIIKGLKEIVFDTDAQSTRRTISTLRCTWASYDAFETGHSFCAWSRPLKLRLVFCSLDRLRRVDINCVQCVILIIRVPACVGGQYPTRQEYVFCTFILCVIAIVWHSPDVLFLRSDSKCE